MLRLPDYVIGEEQAGFRPTHSTSDHIFTLHSIVNIYLSGKNCLYCCFIDYEEVFDRVDRSLLWTTVLRSVIDGKVLRFIYNLYLGAKSCVKIDNNLSEIFPCKAGVTQGENLSPLLFAIFLNDLKCYIENHYDGLSTISHDFTEYIGFAMICTILRDCTHSFTPMTQ